jgi:hypothetical protein
MYRFQKWFRKSSRTDRRSNRRSQTFRPTMGQLEERQLLTLAYYGGPVIPNVQVETLYLGQDWADSSRNLPMAQQLTNFFTWITNSPYMDSLGKYGVNPGQFIGTDTDTAVFAGGSIDDLQIQGLLNSEIAAKRLASPTANSLYFVYAPPGTGVTTPRASAGSFIGYHSYETNASGQTVYYAVIPYPSVPNPVYTGINAFQQLTLVSSHELADAVIDPTFHGWADNQKGPELFDQFYNNYPFPPDGGFVDNYLLSFSGAGSLPPLALTSISPGQIGVGYSSPLTLTVTGSDFYPDSVVDWNGTALATTYVSGTTLTATIPASDFTSWGKDQITVVDPTTELGGGTTNSLTFSVVNPPPTLTEISPKAIQAINPSGPEFLRVTGSNFFPQLATSNYVYLSSEVDLNGVPLNTIYVSATQLMAEIPAIDLASPSTYQITVVNHDFGGGTSNVLTFQVAPPGGAMLKVQGTGGAGANMLAVQENVYDFQTIPGYNYLQGSQHFYSAGVCGVYQAGGVTFVALENGELVKESGTGGTGGNMLAVQEQNGTVSGLPGYNYWLGTQQFSANVTSLVYSPAQNVTVIGLADGRMLKVAGTGGNGQNMFAVTPTDYGFQTLPGYSYLLGSQKFSTGVSCIDLVSGVMFVGLNNNNLVKVSGTGGTGGNMLAVQEQNGTVSGLPGYNYWLGTQQFLGNVTGLVYSPAQNVIVIGLSDGRMLKVAGTGGFGQNMFAVTPTNYGFQTLPGYSYLVGSQMFSTGVDRVDLVSGVMFVDLSNGNLVKESGTGATGANMLCVQEQNGTVTGLPGYNYWLGTEQFSDLVTGLVYSPTDNVTVIGLDDGQMLKVAGTGGNGQNMFAVTLTPSGFQTLPGYSYLKGSQMFDVPVTGLYQVSGSLIVTVEATSVVGSPAVTAGTSGHAGSGLMGRSQSPGAGTGLASRGSIDHLTRPQTVSPPALARPGITLIGPIDGAGVSSIDPSDGLPGPGAKADGSLWIYGRVHPSAPRFGRIARPSF